MVDFLGNVDFNTVFSGLSFVVGSIVIFMLKSVSKKTETTIDDKIVEAFEIWMKKSKEANKKK